MSSRAADTRGTALDWRNSSVFIACAFALLVAWQRQPRFYHAEPVIELYRFLDPTFLTNDFFANTLDGYHYQYFFTLLGGAVVRLFGTTPEIALSFIAYLSVIGASASVFYAGYLLNGRSVRAGALTSLLVGVTLFSLGGLGPYLAFARPWAFAQPFVVVAIAFTCIGRPVAAAVTIGIASLFHPLVGAVMGAVCLFSAWADCVIFRPEGPGLKRFLPRRPLIGGAIYLAFLLPNLIYAAMSWNEFRLPTQEFVDITIFYRHPQHYVTSYWLTEDVTAFIWCMLAGGTALFHPRIRSFCTRPMALIILSLFGVLLLSYLLIEIFPTRLGASLMGYRFSINLHYILVLFAGRFVFINAGKDAPARDRAWAYMMILAFLGIAEGYAVLSVFGGSVLALHLSGERQNQVAGGVAALLCVMLFFAIAVGDSISLGHLAAAGALIAALEGARRLPKNAVALAAGTAIATLAVLGVHQTWRAPAETAAREAPEHDIARAAARKTGRDAVFVTPPGLELIRTVAHRAIVVGYEFPFLDAFIKGWNERARTVWGDDPLYVQHALETYRRIPDARLVAARTRYDATHAILFSETSTSFTPLYDNGKYKIVELR